MADGNPPVGDSKMTGGDAIDFGKAPEVAGKVILVLVAVAYTAGFLISNISLASYGAGAVELIRAEYILIGATFLLLCGAASLYCVQMWRAMTARTHISARIHALQLCIVSLTYPVVMWFMTQLLASFHEMSFRDTFALLLPIIVSPVFTCLPYVFYRGEWVQWPHLTPAARTTTVGWTIMAYCLSLLMFLGVYAQTTYPLLDRTYGGGRPIRVKIVLDDSENAALRETLATVLDEQSGGCELVAETSDWILIRKYASGTVKQSRPVRISRSTVRAIMPASDL